MAVLLPDSVQPMGNFPAVKSSDVEITLEGGTKKRLQTAYNDGDLGGEGGGIKPVDEMPENPSEDEVVLYIGDNDPDLEQNHLYKYVVDSSPDYYAYKASQGFLYTTDEEPTSNSQLYEKNYYGEMEEYTPFSQSFEADTFTVVENDGDDPVYYYRDSDYDELNKTGWNDISEIPYYYYRLGFGVEIDWKKILMPHREPCFLLAVDNMYAVTNYVCTFSPYLNYRQNNVWTAQSGSHLVSVVETGFEHNIYVNEMDVDNPPIYNNLLVDDGSNYNNYDGQCEIDTYRYPKAIFKYYNGWTHNYFTYVGNNPDTFEPMVDDIVYSHNGFPYGVVTSVDSENEEFEYEPYTGGTSTVSYSEMSKANIKTCINFDSILEWYNSNNSPDINGMRFKYLGKEPHTEFEYGHVYECGYDTSTHQYTYTDITTGDDTARSIASAASAQASEIEQNIALYNSYSLNETFTGGTWIDGKPIYKKTYYMGTVPTWSSGTVFLRIPFDVNFETVVEIKGMIVPNASSTTAQIEYYSIPKPPKVGQSSFNVSLKIKPYNNVLNLELETNSELNNKDAYATVYYTKNA